MGVRRQDERRGAESRRGLSWSEAWHVLSRRIERYTCKETASAALDVPPDGFTDFRVSAVAVSGNASDPGNASRRHALCLFHSVFFHVAFIITMGYHDLTCVPGSALLLLRLSRMLALLGLPLQVALPHHVSHHNLLLVGCLFLRRFACLVRLARLGHRKLQVPSFGV